MLTVDATTLRRQADKEKKLEKDAKDSTGRDTLAETNKDIGVCVCTTS